MNADAKRRLARLEQETAPREEFPEVERVILPDIIVVDAPAPPPAPAPKRHGPVTRIERVIVEPRWREHVCD